MRLQTLDVPHERRFESLRRNGFPGPSAAVGLVPLRLVGGDLRLVRRHLAEHQLADRKHLQAVVADEAHVEFASLDVFLGDDVVVGVLVQERDALAELLVGLDERGLGDAVGGLLLERLDEDGKLQVRGRTARLPRGMITKCGVWMRW
jgi:hypothetical protein